MNFEPFTPSTTTLSDAVSTFSASWTRLNDPCISITMIECILTISALEEIFTHFTPDYFTDEEVDFLAELYGSILMENKDEV
jgi:hypothetical protein